MRFADLVHLHSGSDLTTYEIKTVFRQFCEAVLFIVFYVFFSIILMDICLSSYSMCIYVSIVVLILACPTVWFKKEQYHINILCDTVLIKKLLDIGFVLRHYCSVYLIYGPTYCVSFISFVTAAHFGVMLSRLSQSITFTFAAPSVLKFCESTDFSFIFSDNST